MTRAPEAVRRLFRIGGKRAAAFEPADAIFPGYEAPVVRTAGDGERELVVMVRGCKQRSSPAHSWQVFDPA